MNSRLPNEKLLINEDEIKAFLHPTRMRMLKLLGKERFTLTQLALAMGTIPANLSRHIKKLEAAGLVILVEKRETGRNLEKYYRAAAVSFRLGEMVPSGLRSKSALSLLAESISEAERRDSDALTYLLALKLSEEGRKELIERLARLVEEYKGREDKGGEGMSLSIALYSSPLEAHPQTAIIL